ncbi:hypothetical protein PISL3812_09366 [Talaromyces islandicus]|uniref:Alcohol dehydrogenase-like C-terminal domain-containing protein n=1 Tax=Talaromyces islandicus TaxID=28573 RepID=A0A0U1M9U5_TALIS|nr:hypothetical protein PISL3812_09366 [Talaromyces islandicus]
MVALPLQLTYPKHKMVSPHTNTCRDLSRECDRRGQGKLLSGLHGQEYAEVTHISRQDLGKDILPVITLPAMKVLATWFRATIRLKLAAQSAYDTLDIHAAFVTIAAAVFLNHVLVRLTYRRIIMAPSKKYVFEMASDISPAVYTVALCSGSAALRAVRVANVRPYDVVVVVGIAGAIGHLSGLILKKANGAKVIGVDLAWKLASLPPRCDEYCDRTLAMPDVKDQTLRLKFLCEIRELCNELRRTSSCPRLADAVINTATSADAFLGLHEVVCDGGYIVCVGVPRGDANISIPVAAIVERHLTIRGTLMGSPRESYEVMEYIRSGLIKPVITQIGLQDVPSSMDKIFNSGGFGKTVVRVNGPLASTSSSLSETLSA